MSSSALLRLEALRNKQILCLESRMHGNVPVRFGRGRLDSLGNKGLAAYLIAGHFGLRAHVDVTSAPNIATQTQLGVSDECCKLRSISSDSAATGLRLGVASAGTQ